MLSEVSKTMFKNQLKGLSPQAGTVYPFEIS